MATQIGSALLAGGLRQSLPLVVRGEGAWLTDASGRRYLDAGGGAGCLGHGHPRVAEAMREQLDHLIQADPACFANAPAEALARALIDRAPPGFGDGAVALLGSGAEAVEAAFALARRHHAACGAPLRRHVIRRRLDAHAVPPGTPPPPETSDIPPCLPYRRREPGESEETYGQRAAEALETEILALGPARIAAFLVEPVAGGVPPPQGHLRRLRAICDRHGVLLVADETLCGLGRCGAWFACTEEGIAPDLLVAESGLGAGGSPLAALLVAARLAAAPGELAVMGSSHAGQALACAASLAVVETIERERLLAAARRQGQLLGRALRDAFGQHRHVGDISGRGLSWSLELVEDRARRTPFPPGRRLAARLAAAALAEGLVCRAGTGRADGLAGDHLLLAPPFTVTEAEIAEIVLRLRAALAIVLAG